MPSLESRRERIAVPTGQPLPSLNLLLAGAASLLGARYGVRSSVHCHGGDRLVPGPIANDALDLDDYPLAGLAGLSSAAGQAPVDAVRWTLQQSERAPALEMTLAARSLDEGAPGHADRWIEIEGEGQEGGTGFDVSQILGHLGVVVRAALERPEATFGAIDILTEAERSALLGSFNGALVEYPKTTLHGLFVAQARRTPLAVALIDGDRSVTYAELDAASNRVAHHVRAHVHAAGQVVAVMGPRALETIVVKIGVMKAGAAFMYIDPATPQQRAEQLCGIAAPVALVAPRGRAPQIARAPMLTFEDVLEPGSSPDTAPDEIADESTAAYVLFTSGSTGEPKGVVRPHRMNTTGLFLEQRLYGLGPQDRHLLKSVPFFRELFWPLSTGGAAVVARPGGERDDAYLVELIRSHDITVSSFVPSMLRVLLANPAFRRPGLPIEHLFVAGEALDVELERRLRASGFNVHVTYTMAEADYLSHRAEAPPEGTSGVHVGRPLGMRLYCCDERGRLRPPGFVGELWAGGPMLSSGYIHRPTLTAERFVPNPFEPEIAPVVIRTGDLGLFRRDGGVEFIGRADQQVKISGNRVEPIEVEQHIRTHPAVDNVVVSPLPDARSGYLLAAYVVLKQPLRPDTLREHLAQRLPGYMVPAYFVDVPALPLLPSGKVDRAALRVARSSRPAGLDPIVTPETDLEKRIASAWSRVLGVEQIGLDDPFTALGGDSLKTMVLRIALESDLGRPVRLATLMQCPTVRDLAEALEASS